MALKISGNYFLSLIRNRVNVFFLLGISVVVLFFVYDYQSIIKKQPQSIHAWRQTDCATQAVNYAQRDFNFFRPQIHGQVSEDYQSGYCMEEFPVFYYFVGILFKVFGHHDFFYRATVLSLFLLSLFYLLGLYRRTVRDDFWAFAFTVFLFTSPVIVFYANNFILNIPAFSVTIIAWFYFFNYLGSRKNSTLILSISLFTLASLLKISELISVFTIIGVLLLDYFRIVPYQKEGRLFLKPYRLVIYSLVSVAIVFAWYYYSHYFNNLYGQTYYIYTTGDIFSLSPERRARIGELIVHYWSHYYHNRIALYLYMGTMLFNFIFIRRVNRLLMSISSIMLFGSGLFVLLFYRYLHDHDYYIISLYITTIFSTITLMELLVRDYNRIISSTILKAIFIIFLMYSAHYTVKKMSVRYHGWENNVYHQQHNDLYFIKPYLQEIGVQMDDKVISIPDGTPNVTLYLMNRLGWTNFIERDNSKLIPLAIERGASYLIINDPKLLDDESIKPYLEVKVGEFRNTTIYRVDGLE